MEAFERSSKSAKLLGHAMVGLIPLYRHENADVDLITGQFFYKADNEESDIEVLTGALGSGAHFTNQNHILDGKSTTSTCGLPADVTSTMYEYRLDWLEDRTEF